MASRASVVVNVVSTPSTATMVNGQTSFTANLTGAQPANALIGAITVQPADWNGQVALDGADAGLFTVVTDAAGNMSLIVGPAGLPVRATAYNVGVNATP